jgi:histidinol-phosphate/aromatic aminotransferase/cobyric acid decarboxylase-like protein
VSVAQTHFDSLAQAGIRGLRTYDPGHDLIALRRQFGDTALAELGANENAYGPSQAARGVVLRPLAGYGLPEYLRVTVGTHTDNRRLLDLLDELGAGGIAP